jgi:hypothetical protein
MSLHAKTLAGQATAAPTQPEPVAPPMQPPPPIGEPEPDRLPDEVPLPNPDENDGPSKTAACQTAR